MTKRIGLSICILLRVFWRYLPRRPSTILLEIWGNPPLWLKLWLNWSRLIHPNLLISSPGRWTTPSAGNWSRKTITVRLWLRFLRSASTCTRRSMLIGRLRSIWKSCMCWSKNWGPAFLPTEHLPLRVSCYLSTEVIRFLYTISTRHWKVFLTGTQRCCISSREK